MKSVTLTSKVGHDGVLTVPLARDFADQEVKITVEPLTPITMQSDAWAEIIAETAGRWQGELQRPSQGELERRDQWSSVARNPQVC